VPGYSAVTPTLYFLLTLISLVVLTFFKEVNIVSTVPHNSLIIIASA